jgi:hypothetical protein
MSTFNESKTRIRRFLRDTAAAIWSNEMVRNAFNAAQYEIAQKALTLETVNAYAWPPQFHTTYVHDWEAAYGEGEKAQVLPLWQANSISFCYSWEPAYWITASTAADSGSRVMLPWECAYAEPNDAIPIPLHSQVHKLKWVAFDEETIGVSSQAEISKQDRDYRTRTGRVQTCYRPDVYHNELILYPRPSSATFQETDEEEVYDDDGGIVLWREDAMDFTDAGIVTEAINHEGAVVCAFEILPTEVSSDAGTWDDDLDWPDFAVKYVEYAALERLFGADNDGFVPSLRDYWGYRKQVGINALKTYRRRRMSDRTFFMGQTPRRTRPHLRLPDEYPAI